MFIVIAKEVRKRKGGVKVADKKMLKSGEEKRPLRE